jgi:hypothetical protein
MNQMKIVRSPDDINEFYYYSRASLAPQPKSFPCVMIEDDNDYGIMGNARSYRFKYPPAGVIDIESWLSGFYEGFKSNA